MPLSGTDGARQGRYNTWKPLEGLLQRSYDTYTKLKYAGLKATPHPQKRRAQLLEPELSSKCIMLPTTAALFIPYLD